VYHTSAGGEPRGPWEAEGQLRFAAAPPVLAEVRSVQVSTLTPPEVAQDLTKPGRFLRPSFIPQTAQRVGQLAVHQKVKSPNPGKPG
jgi:hypothetical protein